MEAELKRQFAADHLQSTGLSFVRDGDLRYVGQGYELKIPFPPGAIGTQELAAIWARFHKAHEREYGHAFVGSPIEIVNLRVVGIGQMPKIAKLAAPKGMTLEAARVRTGQCVFRVDGELRAFTTSFYRRHLLPVGEVFSGPAIVLQKDSTTVIPPGCRAVNDPAGNLILTIAMND